MRNPTRTILLVALATTFFAADTLAQDAAWTARLVGTWNQPTAGRQQGESSSAAFDLDGEARNGSGVGLAVERRFGRRFGVEAGVEQLDLDLQLNATPRLAGLPGFHSRAGLDVQTVWLGVDWHLVSRPGFDLWLGPLAARVDWDDFTFVVDELDAEAGFRGNDDLVPGAQLGFAAGRGRWRFVSTLRYLNFEVDSDAREAGDAGFTIDVAPLQLGVGIGMSF